MDEDEARSLAAQISYHPGRWHTDVRHNTSTGKWTVYIWQGDTDKDEENGYSLHYSFQWSRLQERLGDEAEGETNDDLRQTLADEGRAWDHLDQLLQEAAADYAARGVPADETTEAYQLSYAYDRLTEEEIIALNFPPTKAQMLQDWNEIVANHVFDNLYTVRSLPEMTSIPQIVSISSREDEDEKEEKLTDGNR